MFVTNPLGAKLEQQVAEEGEGGFRGNSSNINLNWDGVWDVATQRTSEGWVAEIGIPMVTAPLPARRAPGLGRQLHAEHPPEERAGFLGADSEGIHRDPGQSGRHNGRRHASEPRP